jgi:hypothetical protein
MGWCYRAGLSLAIAGLLVAIYDSWNIAWVGRLIAVLIVISWWGVPSVKLAKNLFQIAGSTKKRWRLSLVAMLSFGCVCFLPVPYRQFGNGWMQPESMRGVYSPTSGLLLKINEDAPTSGSLVTTSKELFSIHDVDAIQEEIRAKGLYERAKAEFEANRQSQSSKAFATALDNATKRLEEASAEVEKCTIKAAMEGQLLVMPATPPSGPVSLEADSMCSSWGDATQGGRMIPSGTLLATICGSQMVAIIPLNDSQLEWIASGVEVRLRSVERKAEVYKCQVDKVVPLEDVSATLRLINGDLGEATANSSSAHGGSKNGSAVYAAQVHLPEGVVGSVGTRVDGVFVAPSQTIASLGYRWLQQNLRWLAD